MLFSLTIFSYYFGDSLKLSFTKQTYFYELFLKHQLSLVRES